LKSQRTDAFRTATVFDRSRFRSGRGASSFDRRRRALEATYRLTKRPTLTHCLYQIVVTEQRSPGRPYDRQLLIGNPRTVVRLPPARLAGSSGGIPGTPYLFRATLLERECTFGTRFSCDTMRRCARRTLRTGQAQGPAPTITTSVNHQSCHTERSQGAATNDPKLTALRPRRRRAGS
jgi:hypothetical protein